MPWILSTAAPAVLLALLGWLLPWALQRYRADTLSSLLQSLAASAFILVLVGTTLFAWLYSDAGLDPETLIAGRNHLLHLGLAASLLWGPVLLLTGFVLATGIERRKGEAMVRRRDDGASGKDPGSDWRP
ncbi:MAG: hypothetical protein AAFR35_06370 [Pseudomonadota bacterium]